MCRRNTFTGKSRNHWKCLPMLNSQFRSFYVIRCSQPFICECVSHSWGETLIFFSLHWKHQVMYWQPSAIFYTVTVYFYHCLPILQANLVTLLLLIYVTSIISTRQRKCSELVKVSHSPLFLLREKKVKKSRSFHATQNHTWAKTILSFNFFIRSMS